MSDPNSKPFPTLEELAALLPPYEIQYCVHEGLTSAVYLARQTALERLVMIRIMPEPDPANVPLLLDRLRKRARLVDPKIVSVFDFGRTAAGPLYLVTEYVDGGMLDAVIQDQQVTPKHAFQLANQLCDTLQMVHDLHIVHGALSSRTILVTKDWHLKVTGIGMSETADGELSWMEESTATYADDIHALGSVIHEMFAGKLPYPDGRVSSLLPPAFGKVVERCITDDLTRRYQQPREVRAALAEALIAEKKANAPVQRTVVSAKPAGAVAPAARAPGKPAGPPAGAKPVQAPPKYIPGHLPPRPAPPPPPSFLKRVDAFLLSSLRTSLHLMIFGVTVILLGGLILFKDKIVFENADNSAGASATSNSSEPAKEPPNTPPPPPPKKKAPGPVRPLTDMEKKYVTVVQKEIAAARDEKRTEDLTFLRRELQRVQGGRGVPAKDEKDAPEALKRIREAYRKAE